MPCICSVLHSNLVQLYLTGCHLFFWNIRMYTFSFYELSLCRFVVVFSDLVHFVLSEWYRVSGRFCKRRRGHLAGVVW